MKQLISGSVIDGLFDLFDKKSAERRAVKNLTELISYFQVSSKTGFEKTKTEYPSSVSVLINLLQRGMPSRMNIFALNYIVNNSSVLTQDNENIVSIDFRFENKSKEITEHVFRSLHLIEPRLNRENLNIAYDQSWEKLGSEFEENFYYSRLPDALEKKFSKNADFLLQLVTNQRSIANIIENKINTRALSGEVRNNFHEQRTDFSIEYPYFDKNKSKGIVIEIDGIQHQTDKQRYLDTERDRALAGSGWNNTLRIKTSDFKSQVFFEKINKILLPAISNQYVKTCYQNYSEPLWNNDMSQELLEICLIPFAVARIQRCLLELIAHKKHPSSDTTWKIAVLERDVPCARLAVDDLIKLIESINTLTNEPFALPEIDLDVFATKEFKNSKFQKQPAQSINQFNASAKYDLVLDISILERSSKPQIVFSNATEIISIRSIHYSEVNRKVFTGAMIQYKPFCVKENNTDNWKVFDKNAQAGLEYLLQSIFRKHKFRDGQLPIINNALQCKSVIGLLPTGGGKSLTYQLSALLQPGICLVVDPIRSLMKDQVDGLIRNNIDSCSFINSTLQGEEKRKAMRKLAEGKVQFSFISPERLQMDEFRILLNDMYENNTFFSYCVIDEAHCVSEWGHDFRTAYLRLGENAIRYCKTKNLKSLPLFGLTATASYDVLADVQRELSGDDELNRLSEDAIIRAEYTKRHELQFIVEEVTFSENNLKTIWDLKKTLGSTKRSRVKRLIKEIPEQIPEFCNNPLKVFSAEDWGINEKGEKAAFDRMKIKNFSPYAFYQDSNAALIFCPHTRGHFGVTDKFKLDYRGNPISPRNGYYDILIGLDGLKPGFFMGSGNDSDTSSDIQEESFTNQDSFINNELNLMIATKAFGMGIDKENIRYTIHINYPGSLESYVQEAGRAGRDGKIALSYILFNDQNVGLEQEEIQIDNDLDINMYFHRNSFKGELKELAILDELLTEIHFPDRTFELEVLIANSLDIDVKCNYWEGGHNKRLYINLGFNESLGFLDLNTLDYITTGTVNKDFSDQIFPLLTNYIGALHLNEPVYLWMQRSDNKIGIEELLNNKKEGESFQLTVGFFNNTKKRIEFISRWLQKVVHKSFKDNIVQKMRTGSTDATAFIKQVCDNYKKFAGKELDFESHCLLRDKAKNNPPGTAQRMFMELYNGYRDKMDTEKAIYRLASLGIVDDYTVNFSSNTFTLFCRKKSETDYRKHLKNYLLKYYSEKTTDVKLEKLKHIKEKNPIRKYLNFLVYFVYENIRNKRFQAINDIKSACRETLDKGEDGPVWFKDFIDLYFNSKYARVGYQYSTPKKEVNASLADLTELGKIDNVDLVWFFMQVIEEDQSGSQIDNLKHLRGACTRMSTSILEPSYSIRLLHSFSLYMLEFRSKRYLEEAEMHLFEAFSILQEKEKHLKEKVLKDIFDQFVRELHERNTLLRSFMKQYKMTFDFDSIMIQRYLEPLQKATHTLRNLNEILN